MKKYTITTGTSLAYDLDATWAPINIRSAAFAWAASGSGTGEYYLTAAGGGNPNAVLSGLVEPTNVQADGTALTAGTAGSLTASQWDWADNDTLGFSTIYVRLSDDADPDTKADGFVTFTDPPKANDDVFFRGSANIAGGDFSNIELDDIIILPGYTGTIGDATTPLKLDTADASSVEFAGTGVAYLSLSDAAVSVSVTKTANTTGGSAGLNIVDSSALNDLFAQGGSTKLINSSVDDAYVASGATLLGDAASTCTGDLHNDGGTIDWAGTGADIYTSGGTSTVRGTDAWAVVSADGGTIDYRSSGTVTQATATGQGVVDFTRSSVGQTVTNAKIEGSGKIRYDATTTLTNVPTGDGTRTIAGGSV